jgi:hypothetical protein
MALAACQGVAPDGGDGRIGAGATAQALHVANYETERVGDARVIRMFAADETLMGTLTLTKIRVGEIGIDGVPVTAQDLEREDQIAVRYKNSKFEWPTAMFRAREKPGVTCPGNLAAPRIAPHNAWAAALTDPALAPFLDELDLEIDVADDTPLGQVSERPYTDVCNNHRVPAIGTDYFYDYCNTSGANQYLTYHSAYEQQWWCQANRECYGSSGEGGNGYLYAGWQSCCNVDCPGNSGGSCTDPVPSTGGSCKPDCSGFGAGGCKATAPLNFYCMGSQCVWEDPCHDDCGEYQSECCLP